MKAGAWEMGWSGETLIRIFSRSTPETPSTMQWCTFEISAKRSPSRPSTTQISHKGRARSRCCCMMRAERRLSCSSLPGLGRLVWRTW